ncbi:hypothetical protein VQ042_22925 [Aurantimonas sp. A2-1-M11]|uniref:hypothetical protein n=1 Tax=Aurantimonas sp. A2-1-M11 TaxID=3113712 RepID=UPI002F95BBEA
MILVDGPTGDAITTKEAVELTEVCITGNIDIIQFATNRGIGAGLNNFVKIAKKRSDQFLIVFDQDTLPNIGIVEQLIDSFRSIQMSGEKIAALGPVPITAPGHDTKAPTYRERRSCDKARDIRAVDFLITSGCLLSLEALEDVGNFNEPYRMDAIDVEWCFRAWSKGWSVWVDRTLYITHSVGEARLVFGPLNFPKQNMSRMRTYIRNQCNLLTLEHVPWHWKIRTTVYLPLQIAVFAMNTARPIGTVRILLHAVREGLRFQEHRSG